MGCHFLVAATYPIRDLTRRATEGALEVPQRRQKDEMQAIPYATPPLFVRLSCFRGNKPSFLCPPESSAHRSVNTW